MNELSAAELWAGFLAHCGKRKPRADLMLDYARGVAGSGSERMLELRIGTIMAILRTRMACDRPIESVHDVRRAARSKRGRGAGAKAVVDSD